MLNLSLSDNRAVFLIIVFSSTFAATTAQETTLHPDQTIRKVRHDVMTMHTTALIKIQKVFAVRPRLSITVQLHQLFNLIYLPN